jgi:inorganic triphosphatase YgiF
MEEIELKAGLAKPDLARLARRLARRHRLEVHSLHARYFDTEDATLARAGLALRIRSEDGRRIQTLKVARATEGGFHHVREVEAPATGPRPDLDLLPDPDIREFLAPLDLRPCFETRVRRRTAALAVPGGRVEVALDRGSIRARVAQEPISEVEFELLEGSPEAVFDCAASLLSSLPARLDLPSKAARGSALAGSAASPSRPPSRPAPAPPTIAAGEAFDQLLATLARSVAVHLHMLHTSDDPEGPHQLRVALRRLRVALRFFRPILDAHLARDLAEAARDIGRLVSPLRDADVLVADHLLPHADPPLAASLARLRNDTRADTRQRLLAAGATAFAIRLLKHASLGGWQRAGARARLQAPLLAILAPGFDRLWSHVRHRGNRLASLDPEDRHELRKDLKKLRYASELLKTGPRQKLFTAALKKLQEDLGALNDLAVLQAFAPRLATPSDEAALEALKHRLLASSRSRADLLMGRACRHWQALAASDPWWRPARKAPPLPALAEQDP